MNKDVYPKEENVGEVESKEIERKQDVLRTESFQKEGEEKNRNQFADAFKNINL
jgi:hypothetical protein